MRIVQVEWKDATSKDQPLALSDFEPLTVYSFGILWEKNKKVIVLVNNLFPHPNSSDYIIIPRDWVQRIKTLRA